MVVEERFGVGGQEEVDVAELIVRNSVGRSDQVRQFFSKRQHILNREGAPIVTAQALGCASEEKSTDLGMDKEVVLAVVDGGGEGATAEIVLRRVLPPVDPQVGQRAVVEAPKVAL